MYTPAAFVVTDLPKLHAAIEAYSFAVLVSPGEELIASHLPLLLDRDSGPYGTLIGHMARANPQWQSAAGRPVLAIFSGPHAYISPTWYEAANVVPTWNYVAVHAHGILEPVEDRRALTDIVQRTVEVYERSMPRPWSFDPSGEFAYRLLDMIVGFRIDIERIEGKWKLSQNHAAERRERVSAALRQQGGPNSTAIADLLSEPL